MKTKRNYFYKYHFKKSQIFFFFFFIIVFLSIFYFIQFNKKVTPKLLQIANSSINKLNETMLTNFKVKDVYPKIDLEHALIISKNKNDEIISVDFDLEKVYQSLSMITSYLQDTLEEGNYQKEVLKYYNENLSMDLDTIILSIPMGVASPYIYLNNLGPRIPVKISYMGYVTSNVRIKLENYGINNVLISIYIDCSITNEFLIPVLEQEIKHNYSILVVSKIIQGIVPTYYGGVIEKNSSIMNVPIENKQ